MAVWEDYKLANQFKPAGLGGLSSSCIESCLGVHQLLGAPAGCWCTRAMDTFALFR